MRVKLSPSTDGFVPHDIPHATPRVQTPATSWLEPEDIILGAVAYTSSPAPFMLIGYFRKASAADGEGPSVYFGVASSPKAVSETGTEDDDPPGMEASYADLSAAGDGTCGVEVVGRGGSGTPIRLISWGKLSVTSSIQRAGQDKRVRGESESGVDSISRGSDLTAATFAQFTLLNLWPLEVFLAVVEPG